MFLPTTQNELARLGWHRPDVVLVTGDAYIDSPFTGVAVIGRVLAAAGFRVGIIDQPALDSGADIGRLGEPLLFWGVTGGSVDSMVANYTATGKRRKTDDHTPGGMNTRRPDRAVIAYSNLIRAHFKKTRPIVLGGIEASLRRIAHYDFWSNRIRRSILFDAKADLLVYGMGETAVLAIARRLQKGLDVRDVRGICYPSIEKPDGYQELPSFAAVANDKALFTDMFHRFYQENDPVTATGLVQRQDTRYLVQNPPSPLLDQMALDAVYALPFQHAAHPEAIAKGNIRALETIGFSVTTHRGCYGECNFCAITVHQGRTVQWRSPSSVLAEVRNFTKLPGFKGIVQDVGGPTANMYGFECEKKHTQGVCRNRRCLFPDTCARLPVSHQPQLHLLEKIRRLPGVRKVFVRSGIRCDLVAADKKFADRYLSQLAAWHVSGQLKVAPEHADPAVLALMGKTPIDSVLDFKRRFEEHSRKACKEQFLTYYFIAAHPGCGRQQMEALKTFSGSRLQISPEQVQVFTPTPSTYSSLMYWTGRDPFSGRPVFVERNVLEKEQQKHILTRKPHPPPVAARKRSRGNPRKPKTG